MTTPQSQIPQSSACTSTSPSISCQVDRRRFLQTLGVTTAAAGTFSLLQPLTGAYAAPSRSSAAENAIQRLFETLSLEQRALICFDYNDPLQQMISANWAVTKATIHSDFYTKEQRGLIAEIFKSATSETGHQRFLEQMEFDDGGWDRYHVALFGNPATEKFEFLMSGLHFTLRADGNSKEGSVFGGPVVYGHGEEEPEDNLFFYQTQRANEVFQALDPEQARKALIAIAPRETHVHLQGKNGQFTGLSVKEFSSDQKDLLAGVVKSLLAPYRKEDISEAMETIEQSGGLDSLNMAFYQQGDLKNDRTWDLWRIEGPSFVCHFRGAPHVHAYLNIGLNS